MLYFGYKVLKQNNFDFKAKFGHAMEYQQE